MIYYLLAGLLGLTFHVLAKMSSVKKDFQVANKGFYVKKFFEDEMISIGMSAVVILIMAITLKEWLSYKPGLENYVRLIFVLGGAIGSWAFGLFLGKSKKYIRNIVDEKTNIADAKVINED